MISEIESRTIKFDSANWPKFQPICVEWGDKVAPFIKPNKDSHKRFTNELGKLRNVIHDPMLPSDYSGAPLQNAFNNMIGEAKQRLQEIEQRIPAGEASPNTVCLRDLKIKDLVFSSNYRVLLLLLAILLSGFSIGLTLGSSRLYKEKVIPLIELYRTQDTIQKNQGAPMNPAQKDR